jgi:hypothetical protein
MEALLSACPYKRMYYVRYPGDEFMNVQFRRGFWA